MRSEAQRLRRILEHREPAQPPADAIPRLFQEKPAGEAARVLWEATHDLDATTLGNQVFPAIRKQLRADDAVFGAMVGLVANRRIKPAFRVASLNFLDRAARARKDRGSYYDELRGAAVAASQPMVVRVAAMRSLAGDAGKGTADVLGAFLKSGKPPLINAAAAVLSQWKDRRVKGKRATIPSDLTRRLVRHARVNSKQALRSSAVIGALARLSPPSLRKLAGKVRTPDQLATLLGAAGNRMDVRTLAQLIRSAMLKPTLHVNSVLQGMLALNPSRLKALHDGRHHHEYLYAASLAPYIEEESAVPRLEKLCHSKDDRLARRARSFVRTLSLARWPKPFAVPAGYLEAVPRAVPPDARKRMAIRDARGGAPARVVGRSFSTGFHLGDALYRDLVNETVVNVFGQHWHTGVYTGFEYARGQGHMRVVNAGGGLAEVAGIADCVFECAAARSFADPEADVAACMRQLKDDFIFEFAEHNRSVRFHGSRRPSGLTPTKRRAIAATACSLLKKDIRYIADDMLNYKWNDYDDWTGEVEAIWNIRCDGVVEYCYEKNGVKVCSGGTAGFWNVASPGAEHLRNHNDFHGGEYQTGELCPRIQAGDLADLQHQHARDTTFVADDPTVPPAIADFQVILRGPVPLISFRINTDAYDDVFVRLTVSKNGKNYAFARTKESAAGADPAAVAADWQFQVVPVGDDVRAYWTGKTAGGPDYEGQDGDFTFRIVAVDRGGNVSELQAITQTIQWPHS